MSDENLEIEPEQLGEFVAKQLGTGVNGIAVGERHASVAMPNLLAEQMPAFKKSGIGALFVEYVRGDQQPLLDKALSGDPKAQRELYTQMIASWGGDTAVEARYNLMFAAHAAGIRVVGIDTNTRNEHLMMQGVNHMSDMRVSMGDTYMAREIVNGHKGQAFMVVVGNAHLAYTGTSEKSGHGSVPERLVAAGLKVAVLNTDTFAMESSSAGITHDVYEMHVPETGERNFTNNPYARLGNNIGYLRDNFMSLAKEAGASAPAGELATVQRHLDAASGAFNACATSQKIAALFKPAATYIAAMSLPPESKAGKYMVEVNDLASSILKEDGLDAARQEITKPGAEAKWLRPAAKAQASKLE